MTTVFGSEITMVRGDTLNLKLSLYDGGGEYTPQAGDTVRFAVKESYKAAECVIVKEIPTDTLILTFAPEDTKNLTADSYVYEIELTTAANVDTFIDNGTLKLKPEVYNG